MFSLQRQFLLSISFTLALSYETTPSTKPGSTRVMVLFWNWVAALCGEGTVSHFLRLPSMFPLLSLLLDTTTEMRYSSVHMPWTFTVTREWGPSPAALFISIWTFPHHRARSWFLILLLGAWEHRWDNIKWPYSLTPVDSSLPVGPLRSIDGFLSQAEPVCTLFFPDVKW